MIRADARHIVAMFIRKATRKYQGRVYTNYQLVRSVQTPKGPRQKMICSLGDLSPRPAEAWRQLAHRVEDALHGQPGLFEGSREPEVEQIVRQVQVPRRWLPATHGPPGSHRCGSVAFVHHADPRRGGVPGDEKSLGRATNLPSTGATGRNAHLPLRVGVSSAGGHRDDARRPRPAHFLVYGSRGPAYASGGHHRAADGRRSGPPDPQSNHPRTGTHGGLSAAERPARNHPPSPTLEYPSSGEL